MLGSRELRVPGIGRRQSRRFFLGTGVVLLLAGAALAPAASEPASTAVSAAVARGTSYLLAHQQADGSWERHAGLTAVVIPALLGLHDRAAEGADAAVARGLAYVERWVQPDGGIYQDDARYYSTAVALLAFAATGDRKYAAPIEGARGFLVGLQAREENGFPPDHPNFGGTLVGAGKANLDATFFAMRALAVAGLPREHAYWARAVRFVSRCQNWRPGNDQPWAAADGGFIFAPGFSFAGGTTSYGSMTYAGLSGYLDAGVPRDDARVEAAFRWLAAHFTARENPNMKQQAVYHSYFYMAETLRRWRAGTLAGDGRPRAWRDELAATLLARQQPDGSWVNAEDPRWWESRPVLATTWAVRALRELAGETRP